ncbi:MAG TPA: phosphodiesterase [Geminicoccus sp.]|uniref:phosphodiesterase n=1 Tax=Geminicoccus sp. TaxID=2024832 RepID=UPI002E3389D1|nr:phosphodiesterase [Geminicoccus sp.]HEX2526584.1 phosphodiesterase [Geminicoccus sp.]
MLICQLTDLHVVPNGRLAYGRVATNSMVARAIDRVASLQPQPDVIIVTGDLTDCGREEEYRLLAGMLERLAPPVLVVPGNHDRRENLQAILPRHLGRLDGSLLHHVVEDFPVRIVMLDTVVPGHGHGELDAASLGWLEARLAEQPGKPTILAMHHPPFTSGIGHMDEIGLRHPERLAAVVARHPQVERVVCGHHHRPMTMRFAGTIASIAPSVVHQVDLDLRPGSAAGFVMEPPAFQLHHWIDGSGLVSHTVYVDLAEGPYPFNADPDYPG